MEKLDKDLQSRVWQRVQSREKMEMPRLGQENVRPLILEIRENQLAYQHLGRQMAGRDGERLRRLQQESQKSLTCLKGIGTVRGETIQIPQWNPGKEPVKRTLMKCGHRERKLASDLQQLSADPEYGPIYGQLSRQAVARWSEVLELLGGLEK